MLTSDQVTAFVVTSGEPSTRECIARLQGQTALPKIEVIDHLAPMHVAFQAMIDRCTTPYYVQVDADMVLDADAIERMMAGITAAPDDVAIYLLWLWDGDVERPIQGVKIYRHEVLRRFPYADALSCEMPQVKALAAAGYKTVADECPNGRHGCAGEHRASQTPEMAFGRWKRLMQKFRVLPWMAWLAPYPSRLEQRWLARPHDRIAQARYLGAIAGLVGPVPEGEADARQADQDYRRLAGTVGEYAEGPRELSLYVTDRCNFRCVFDGNPCLRESEEGAPKDGDLDPFHVAAVLDRWPTIRAVCIAGFGEPLLAPGLLPILDLLAKRRVFAGVITNGALLESRADELEQRRVGYVSVSLNAATAEEHHAMSQTKTWEKVLAGVRRLAAGPIRTGLSFVVTRHNVGRVGAYLALAADLGVQFVHLHNVLPHAGTDNLNFRASVLTVESEDALQQLVAARALPGAELVEAWPEPIDLRPGANPHRCMSPFVSLGLDGRGFVSGCRRVVPPEGAHGHYDDPDIWHTRSGHAQNFVDLRLAVVGDREAPDGCRGCFGNWRS